MAQRPACPNRARCVALCGVSSALSLLFLLGSSFIPFATFTGPFFASLCLIPVVYEFGCKTPVTAYVAISLLAFILVGNKETVLFFVLLTGYYPILQPQLSRIRNRPLRMGLKLLVFCLATTAVYTILLFLFSNPLLLAEFSALTLWYWILSIVAACVTFCLYDILVDKVRILYVCRFRKFIFR